MWMIYAFLSALSSAAVAILAKLGLDGVNTTLGTTLRSIIMTIFLLLVAVFSKSFYEFNIRTISQRDLLLLIFSGLAGALGWLFYFAALKTGFVSKVVAIDRLSLAFAVVMSAVFLSESITLKAIVGVILMTVGSFLLVQ